MTPAPRGMIAGLLGIAGITVPLILLITMVGMPPWGVLVSTVGVILLIPGLFLRHEYRDASMPRILVTLGVIASLLPLLVPEGGTLPLVAVFKGLIDAPGSMKVIAALNVGEIVIVVACLLAWLPAPASGGAKTFAWLLILWKLFEAMTALIIGGHIGDVIKDSPNMALLGWAPESAYLVLVGYGLATVFGKKLE
jgi:hypothetical protein